MCSRPLARLALVAALAFSASLLSPGALSALPTASELAAMQRKQAVAEEQARQEIEALFARLCPGRCELIDVKAITSEPVAVGEVTPGFDGEGTTGAYDVELSRLEVRVMMDSALPNTFMANIPRMLRFRLQRIVPDVRIQPVALEFPKPQMEPLAQPDPIEEPKPEPQVEEPPPEEPAAEPEAPVEEPQPVPEEERSWLRELWETFLPYLPYITILLIVFGILRAVLNWFRDNRIARREPLALAVAGTDGEGSEREMPDGEALKRELTRSRSVQNHVLRLWIKEDPEAVATLVRLVGPDILSDIKHDTSLKAAITEVSQQAARQSEPLGAEEARRIAQATRARITAARIVESEGNMQGDWDFVQGLSVPTLQRIMARLTPREKSFAIGQLPPALRAAFLEQLATRERRELFIDAGSGEPLDREHAVALATRLREEADSIAHLSDAASGQAAVVIDMLRAVDLSEQEDTLREISRRRPEIAQAVFSQVALESNVLHAPPEVVSDAMLRTPLETLIALTRGTRDDVRARLLEHAPSNIRAALLQELELGIPASRSEYLEARATFTDSLASILQREGVDRVALNARTIASASGDQQVG